MEGPSASRVHAGREGPVTSAARQGALAGIAPRIRAGESSLLEEPPVKRPCGPAASDPFPDDWNLTAADFMELDLLGSQQCSSTSTEPQRIPAAPRLRSPIFPKPRASHGPGPRPELVAVPPTAVAPSAGQESRKVEEAFQQEAVLLKDKLGQLQERLHVREGESRILRDSLLTVQATLDELRAEKLRHERDATLAMSARECDLHKQVNKLKSQLLFKDAEMETLQRRLLSLEQCSTRSPRSPWGSDGIMTGSPRFRTPSNRSDSPLSQGAKAIAAEAAEKNETTDCEKSQASEDECDTLAVERQWSQGALLVDKLIHITGACAPLPMNSTTRRGGDTVSTDATNEGGPRDLPSGRALILKGLSRLLHPPGPSDPLSHPGLPGGPQASGSARPCDMAGAYQLEQGIVSREAETLSHFLPFIELRLGRYADAVTARFTSRSGSGEKPAAVATEAGAEVATAAIVDMLALEEEAEAGLQTLVVLLSSASAIIAKELSLSPRQQEVQGGPVASDCCPREIPGEPYVPHPVLKRLVQLLQPCGDGSERVGARRRGRDSVGCSGPPGAPGRARREAILRNVLWVLAQLAENPHGNAAKSLLLALEGSGRLARCITVETPPSTVLQIMQILATLCYQPRALTRLGCGSDLCTLLHVCTYVRTYVHKHGPAGPKLNFDTWLRLQLQLTRLMGNLAKADLMPQLLASSCACLHEMAKALALLFHRAWLSMRGLACHVGDAACWMAPRPGSRECRTGHVMREIVWGLSALSAGSSDGRLWSLLQDAAPPLVEAARRLRNSCLLQSLLPDYRPAEEAALDGLCYHPHVTGEQHSHVNDMEVT